jgi:tetratricopeptide (TPR) repeat protein
MAKPGSQRNPTIESLKDRIARDPFSRAFLQLAEEYRREGRFQEAIEVCLEGLGRHPTYHTARISLGKTYMEAGDMENARRAFSEVLELQPENHLAAKLLAEIQKKTGDFAGAAATYLAILRYYPGDREVAALLREAQGPEPSAAPAVPEPARPPAAGQSRTEGTVTGSKMKHPVAPAPPVSGIPIAHPADPSPDFRQEDLGGVPPAPVNRTWSAPAAPSASSWSAPPGDDLGGPEDDALQTNTLAELYLRQGLVDRAIEVYRGMLRVDPLNQKAARRLNDLAPAMVPPPAPMLVAPAKAPGPRAHEGSTPAAPAPGTAGFPGSGIVRTAPAKDDGGRRHEAIRRLERWLVNVSRAAAKGAPPR